MNTNFVSLVFKDLLSIHSRVLLKECPTPSIKMDGPAFKRCFFFPKSSRMPAFNDPTSSPRFCPIIKTNYTSAVHTSAPAEVQEEDPKKILMTTTISLGRSNDEWNAWCSMTFFWVRRSRGRDSIVLFFFIPSTPSCQLS